MSHGGAIATNTGIKWPLIDKGNHSMRLKDLKLVVKDTQDLSMRYGFCPCTI